MLATFDLAGGDLRAARFAGRPPAPSHDHVTTNIKQRIRSSNSLGTATITLLYSINLSRPPSQLAPAAAYLQHLACRLCHTESGHARGSQAYPSTASHSCSARLVPEEGCLLQSLHGQAQEAKLGRTKGRQGQAKHRASDHCLYSGRRAQLAGALGRAGQGREDARSARSQVSTAGLQLGRARR